MEEPDPRFYRLINRCPKCGHGLYAMWFHRVNGLPLAPVWSVECDNSACDYVYPLQFNNLEELANKFEAED